MLIINKVSHVRCSNSTRVETNNFIRMKLESHSTCFDLFEEKRIKEAKINSNNIGSNMFRYFDKFNKKYRCIKLENFRLVKTKERYRLVKIS